MSQKYGSPTVFTFTSADRWRCLDQTRLWMRGPNLWNIPIYTFDSQHVFQSQRHCCLSEKGCHLSLTPGDGMTKWVLKGCCLRPVPTHSSSFSRDSGCILGPLIFVVFLLHCVAATSFACRRSKMAQGQMHKLHAQPHSLKVPIPKSKGSTQQNPQHSGTLGMKIPEDQ